MVDNNKIIAICLIKNEEFYIEKVIRNILDFCDKIIIADNLSTDNTLRIVKRIADREKKIEIISIEDIAKSQELIKDYAGTSTWIFGVDGDEIYDPAGLKILRKQIIDGSFDRYTQLYGNVLNCSFLDVEKEVGKGYLAPPCRSMTKLYNFALIDDWSDSGIERLHGEVKYKKGFSKSDSLNLHEQYSWEKSYFRCLHLCFLRRSGQDAQRNISQLFARTNIGDLSRGGLRTIIMRLIYSILRINEQSKWKLEKYSRGELVEKDISVFL